jgi:putative ABC transport system permease protein
LQPQRLVVGHLSAIQNSLALEPYEVWLKLKPNASSAKLYEELAATKLPITDIRDTTQQLIASRNDPFQLAIGGVMTLGFLIITIMAFCGFLLFWILSLSGRILQFGTFRSMGLSVRQLIGMIVAEQLLTSGAAFGIGIGTGQLASCGFVPLFRLAYDPSAQVPPFQVAIQSGDRINLILIVVAMMAVGSAILAFLLTRIQLHQAIKLGED